MPRADKRDLVAGLVVIAIGAYFAIGATDYRIGTFMRMGPGFMPLVLGCLAIGLGLVIVLLALGRDGALPRPSLRAALAVLLGIAGFALLLPRAGLVPATVLAVLIARAGSREARPLASLVLACLVAFGCWLVFIAVLGLQMRAFRMPF